MPTNLTAYRVFIASPGGLQAEREAFKAAIAKYNEADAIERGVQFIPVGWESTLGGIGRPQAIINEEVRRCDYFVLLLWDRWGSRPSADPASPYTSGTEEEYHVALECYRNGTMRQIIVFFKAPEIRQLGDPGEHLLKVLDFKLKIEAERSLLFHTFDEITAFEDRLRQYFAGWVRDHEKGASTLVLGPTPPVPPAGRGSFVGGPLGIDTATITPELDRAERLFGDGRHAQAEILFAQAVAKGDDPDAMNRYAQFLRLMGRYAQAKLVFDMAIEWSRQHEDKYWAGVSLNGLAALYHDRGEYAKALENTTRAMAILEELRGPDDPAVATSLDHIAYAHQARGQFADAEPLFQRSVEICRRAAGDRAPAYARSLNNLASLYRAQGRFHDAQPLYELALDILNASPQPWQSEITRSLHGLGIICYSTGRFHDAEPLLARAMEITSRTLEPDHPLVARSRHDLGMLYLAQGNPNRAEPLLVEGLDMAERVLGRDHPKIAYPLNGLGELYFARREFERAESLFRRAIDIRARSLGPRHPLLLQPLENLMNVYKKSHQRSAAKAIKQQIEAIRSSEGGRAS